MSTEEQRRLGATLATAARAVKTRAVIADPTSDYRKILSTAALELSLDDLVKAVLQGPPEWAYQALQSIDCFNGTQRSALLEKAASDSHSALRLLRFGPDLGTHRDAMARAAGALAATQGTISGLYLNNKGSYNCAFTMYWVNGGKTMPPPTASKKWSSTLMVGQDTKMACSEFALPTAPLQDGNEVWMYLWVQAGQDIESPLRFTYSSNTSDVAYFTSSGCTQSDSLALEKIA